MIKMNNIFTLGVALISSIIAIVATVSLINYYSGDTIHLIAPDFVNLGDVEYGSTQKVEMSLYACDKPVIIHKIIVGCSCIRVQVDSEIVPIDRISIIHFIHQARVIGPVKYSINILYTIIGKEGYYSHDIIVNSVGI